MCMNVDLPDPDGPVTATNSPAINLERRSTKRANVHVADVVGLRQILDGNDDVFHRRSRVSLYHASRPRPPPPPGSGSTLWSHQRIAGLVRARTLLCSTRFEAGHDVGDDLGSLLYFVGIEHLGPRAVRDSEAQVDRLELLVDVEPCAAAGLDRRKRAEQRIDGRGVRGNQLRTTGRGLLSARAASLGTCVRRSLASRSGWRRRARQRRQRLAPCARACGPGTAPAPQDSFAPCALPSACGAPQASCSRSRRHRLREYLRRHAETHHPTGFLRPPGACPRQQPVHPALGPGPVRLLRLGSGHHPPRSRGCRHPVRERRPGRRGRSRR